MIEEGLGRISLSNHSQLRGSVSCSSMKVADCARGEDSDQHRRNAESHRVKRNRKNQKHDGQGEGKDCTDREQTEVRRAVLLELLAPDKPNDVTIKAGNQDKDCHERQPLNQRGCSVGREEHDGIHSLEVAASEQSDRDVRHLPRDGLGQRVAGGWLRCGERDWGEIALVLV